MNVVTWVVQGVLSAVFLLAGVFKLTQPRVKLAPQMAWVEDFGDAQVKAIGAVELAAAVGLVLPGATDTAPVLTPLAATGLAIVMVGAAATHVRRHETQLVPINAALLVLAALVAWARFGPYSF